MTLAAYTGSRTQWFSADLLSLTGSTLATIRTVNNFSLDIDTANVLPASGSFDWTAMAARLWLGNLVRIWYNQTGAEPLALGTLVPKAPNEDHDAASVTVRVNLFDRLSVLENDSYAEAVAYPEGTPVMETVISIIQSTGDVFPLRLTVPTTDVTLTAPITFDNRASKLTIVNRLLEAGGFKHLTTDTMGFFQTGPPDDPATAPIAWPFDSTTGHAMYVPKFERVFDVYDVPNRYIGLRKTTGSTPADRAVATDENPQSPYSYQQRGRWVTAPIETDIDAVNFSVLSDIVRTRLNQAQQVAQIFNIEHPVLPIFPDQYALFRHPRVPLTRTLCVSSHYNSKGLVRSALQGLAV